MWSGDNNRLAFVSNTRSIGGNAVWSVVLAERDEVKVVFSSGTYLQLVGWGNDGVFVGIAKDTSGISARVTDLSIVKITSDLRKEHITDLNAVYAVNATASPSG